MDKIELILSILALVFTITLVLYGLSKGFDNMELVINISYFGTLVTQQIYSIYGELR